MEVVIEIVGEGFGFLLEQGEYVLAALVAGGALVAWILRRRPATRPSTST